jgi:L-threonylcarbamoyladenylate synthase
VGKSAGKLLRALLPRPRDEKQDPVVDRDQIREAVIEQVSDGLVADQVGILPTETVYGIFGSALSDAVVQRIYAIKQRDRSKPLPVQIAKASDLTKLGVAVSAHAQNLARNFWPGPLTLVLPFLGRDHCAWKIAPLLLKQWADQKTVAVRIPEHPVVNMVLARAGIPLIATSANISEKDPVTRVDHLDSDLKKKVDWVVDGGPAVFGRERLLREGALRGAVLQRALVQPIP